MRFIRQPNSWSCTVAAAAMVFDCKIQDIISYLEHDGSEVILPHLKPPGCYKGFHIQEIIDFGVSNDFSITPIEVRPVQMPTPHHEFELTKWSHFVNCEDRLEHYLQLGNGLIMGKAREYWHCVAWNRETGLIYDPQGRVYPFDDCKINIATFHLIKINAK